VSLDFNDLSSAGSAFQTAGPAKENALSANLVRERGLMKVFLFSNVMRLYLVVSYA